MSHVPCHTPDRAATAREPGHDPGDENRTAPEQPNSTDDENRRLMDQYTEIAVLAGGLAHEIKNPLSTIRLNLSLLAEDFAQPQGTREQRALQKIRTVERECERLNQILEEFLRFARVKDLRLQVCDLNAVVREMVEFIQPETTAAGIETVSYFRSDLPAVSLDRDLFKQALLNLILNAEHAMPKGGQLVLQTRPVPAGAQLDVIDTGCGMDSETLGKIFRPFFSTRRDGSGLGLPTVRKIVEAHRGTIAVQSAVGKGTQFTITLPAAPEPAAAAAATAPPAAT
jgi:signal transduction histidine kinase